MASGKKRRKSHKNRLPQPGSPPGILTISNESPRPTIHAMAYSPTSFVEKTITNIADLRTMRSQSHVIWVDVCGLGDAEVLRQIGEIFGLHPLTLEDIVDGSHRPKVEGFGSMFYVVARRVYKTDTLESVQFNLLFGPGFVLTFQDTDSDNLKAVQDRVRAVNSRIRLKGADYLAYVVLDTVVDNYYPILEQYDESIEQLEAAISESPSPHLAKEVHKLKHELIAFRRLVAPLRDCLQYLFRDPYNIISDDTDSFLRDSRDHIIHVVDTIESYRDICAGLAEFYLFTTSNRLNESMRVLTVISTIFIPLTFITGIYGMNFDTSASPFNMPELRWPFGYFFALSLMLLVAIGMAYFFYRKGWIGDRHSEDE